MPSTVAPYRATKTGGWGRCIPAASSCQEQSRSRRSFIVGAGEWRGRRPARLVSVRYRLLLRGGGPRGRVFGFGAGSWVGSSRGGMSLCRHIKVQGSARSQLRGLQSVPSANLVGRHIEAIGDQVHGVSRSHAIVDELVGGTLPEPGPGMPHCLPLWESPCARHVSREASAVS